MSFHINSNLSPLEAVSRHQELQVHPIIEVWAEKAQLLDQIQYNEGISTLSDLYSISENIQAKEKIDSVTAYLMAVINDKTLICAVDVKAKLTEIIQTFGLN